MLLLALTTSGVAIVLLFVLLFSLSGLVAIDWRLEPASIQASLFVNTFIYTALIATSEEAILRGIFLQIFLACKRMVQAAVFWALLWAVFHLPSQAGDQEPLWGMALGLTSFIAAGTLLGLVAAGSSFLWIPIGLHYGYNLGFSLLRAAYTLEVTGPPFLTGVAGWISETGLIGAGVWTIVALIIWSLFRN